jgi:hypothetical protein
MLDAIFIGGGQNGCLFSDTFSADKAELPREKCVDAACK